MHHKHKHLIATAQAYLHFAHVYLHSVIKDGGPRRRGRTARNLFFFSSFTTAKQKSKEITNAKKKNIWVRKVQLMKKTLFDLSLNSGDCLLYKEVYFPTASASFSSNSADIFCAFRAGLDSAFVFFR